MTLESGESLNFSLGFQLKDTLFMEVENADNPPLKWDEICFFQNPFSLYTYLKAGEEASIFLGDHKLNLPDYDITNFARQKSDDIPELEIVCAEMLPVTTQVNDKSVFESNYFMWTCIATGGAMLFLFSVKLLRENKDTN